MSEANRRAVYELVMRTLGRGVEFEYRLAYDITDAMLAWHDTAIARATEDLTARLASAEELNFHNGNWIAMAEPEIARLKAAVEQARRTLVKIADHARMPYDIADQARKAALTSAAEGRRE